MLYLIFCLGYMSLVFGLFYLWEKKQVRLPIRLPFTADFRNGPGKTLEEKLAEAKAGLIEPFIVLAVMPFAGTIPFLLVEESQRGFVLLLLALIGIASTFFIARGFLRQVSVVRNLRLGYLGEVYVAQCLMPLVAKGYRLFHDYPGRDFNIDHIAVGPRGIFAVETKARMKPKLRGGTGQVRVRVYGDKLHFPNWIDSQSIPQARRQAAWLSKELSKELGEAIPVTPVLVVPGWFIEVDKKSDVLVCSGAEIERFLPNFGRSNFEREKLLRYVAHFRKACSYRPREPGQSA